MGPDSLMTLNATQVVAGHMAAEAAYGEVRRLLDSRGIECIVLKGPHLNAEYYGSTPPREYTDLDLLIRPGQFEDAVSSLMSGGFTPIKGPEGRYVRGFNSPQGWPVELHRAFESYGLFRVDYEALFERSTNFQFGAESAKGLAREDLLLHLVMHAAKSHFRQIGRKHIDDIALVVKRPIRWEVVLERAREFRCSAASWIFLSAAAYISAADIPPGILGQLQPSWLRRKWLGLWLTKKTYPMFRWRHLPVWLGRLAVLPAIVDRLRDGLSGALRFALVRASDVFGRRRAQTGKERS